MDEKGFLTLTPLGLEVAEKVYERHELFSRLLMYIGVSPETALADACRIEHVISNETFERIKAFAHQYAKENPHEK